MTSRRDFYEGRAAERPRELKRAYHALLKTYYGFFIPPAAKVLELNEVGIVNIATSDPIAFDPYQENRDTGGFILIDRLSNATVGAGMIDIKTVTYAVIFSGLVGVGVGRDDGEHAPGIDGRAPGQVERHRDDGEDVDDQPARAHAGELRPARRAHQGSAAVRIGGEARVPDAGRRRLDHCAGGARRLPDRRGAERDHKIRPIIGNVAWIRPHPRAGHERDLAHQRHRHAHA